MVLFTIVEKADIIVVYGKAGPNAEAPCTLYADRYPNQNYLQNTSFFNNKNKTRVLYTRARILKYPIKSKKPFFVITAQSIILLKK